MIMMIMIHDDDNDVVFRACRAHIHMVVLSLCRLLESHYWTAEQKWFQRKKHNSYPFNIATITLQESQPRFNQHDLFPYGKACWPFFVYVDEGWNSSSCCLFGETFFWKKNAQVVTQFHPREIGPHFQYWKKISISWICFLPFPQKSGVTFLN